MTSSKTFSALLSLCVGIHRSPVNSPHKGQWRRSLMFYLIWALNKRLSKQPRDWWFETTSRTLWRHFNAFSVPHLENQSRKYPIKLLCVTGRCKDPVYPRNVCTGFTELCLILFILTLLNSLSLGRYGCDLERVTFKHPLVIDILSNQINNTQW